MKVLLNKINWTRTVPILLFITLLLWAVGCKPTAQSLIYPTIKVSGPELQGEIEYIIAQYEARKASIEQQQQLRELLLNNTMMIAQTGSVNPVSILTGLLAFYGVGSAANDTRKVVKKIKAKPIV